ncbi:MAG: hypothetical protein U1E45_15115 [Geminicoccaceae bacterium]
MQKATALALVAATFLGAAGSAFAGERIAVQPTAPSFVSELGAARAATVGGTVDAVAGHGRFVLVDALGGTITVDARHLRLQGLAPGQMITVTGTIDEGVIDAGHAILEDGSVAVHGKSSRPTEA